MSADTAPGKSLEAIFRSHGLTRRERETAALLLEGFSNEKIAKQLFLSIPTVKGFVTGIYRKFNVKSRAEFMVKMFRVPGTE